MGGVAGFGERGIGAVPAGVVLVVAGGASFAVAALAAGAAVQDDFMRAGSPVFVDEKFLCFGGGASGFRDESNFSDNFLQARARIAAHGQQRQAVDFLNFAHHGEDGFHRERARFDEVGLHQGQVFAVEGARGGPVVA